MATGHESVSAMTVETMATETVAAGAARPALWRERIAPALFVAGLGMVLLYGVGFAPTVELHNAAHDSRHSAAFPCH
jgi:cobalt transporter subunit CbtB